MSRNTLAIESAAAPSIESATLPTFPKRTITRTEANKLLQGRSVELFQEARREQEQHRTDFESTTTFS